MSSPLAGSAAAAGENPEGEDDGGAGEHTFRDGSSMIIDKAAFSAIAQQILHGPAVIAALTDKVTAMQQTAQSMSQDPKADYQITVVTEWPDSRRARANVWTANYAAMLDDAKHSTLLKTLAHFGGTATQ